MSLFFIFILYLGFRLQNIAGVPIESTAQQSLNPSFSSQDPLLIKRGWLPTSDGAPPSPNLKSLLKEAANRTDLPPRSPENAWKRPTNDGLQTVIDPFFSHLDAAFKDYFHLPQQNLTVPELAKKQLNQSAAIFLSISDFLDWMEEEDAFFDVVDAHGCPSALENLAVSLNDTIAYYATSTEASELRQTAAMEECTEAIQLYLTTVANQCSLPRTEAQPKQTTRTKRVRFARPAAALVNDSLPIVRRRTRPSFLGLIDFIE
jgi:hypothetical protein